MPRLVTAGVLLFALPAAALLPPLVGLAGLVLVLGVLIAVETRRYSALGEASAAAELASPGGADPRVCQEAQAGERKS